MQARTAHRPPPGGANRAPALHAIDLVVDRRASSWPSSARPGPARPPCWPRWPAPTGPHRPASSIRPGSVGAGRCARHKLRARLFLAPQTPPLPPRQRVVHAVLAARLPHWSCGRPSFRSQTRRPRRRLRCAGALRPGRQTVCARRPAVRRRTPALRPGAPAAVAAEVLLVDEPLSALDPTLSQMTLTTLQQEAAARKATLVCSLHQVDMARAILPHRRPARRTHRVRRCRANRSAMR
jgi:phosphonate transport system ATP-binding protein